MLLIVGTTGERYPVWSILQIIFRKVPIFFKKTLIFAVRVEKIDNDSKNTDDILSYSGTCSRCNAFFSLPLVRR